MRASENEIRASFLLIVKYHVMNTCSNFKVPISSKFLFSHMILYFMQLTLTKKIFDLDKNWFFNEFLKTWKSYFLVVYPCRWSQHWHAQSCDEIQENYPVTPLSQHTKTNETENLFGTYTEDLYHLFFNCSFVQAFWNVFAVWWFDLSGEYLTLSLKDIMVGLLQRNDLLNYLIILGKLTIWECRKNKVEVKKQVEKIIAIRNRKLRDFQSRWEFLI